MTVLVTGSSGHLGEALMRTLRANGRAAVGLDLIPGPFTDEAGSIADRALVAPIMQGVDAVLHVATLHKPHVATHAREAFVETNVRGTLILLEEALDAHLLAIERAPAIGFGKYIISATTPFLPGDCARLRVDAPATLSLRAPGWEDEYGRRGWRMFPSIDRVYDNALARRDLGWRPKWDFAAIVKRLRATGDVRGPLAKQVGVKGYHAERFEGAPYPVMDKRS